MAYTPKTWTCGETITDNGLNNIEQGIQEALAGGGSLPEVTSADDDKVLTVVNGEWAKADRGYKCDGDNVETTECFEKAVESLLGYECKETATLLTQESVTTVAEMGVIVGSLSYSQSISADTIRVTFGGTEYICDKTDTGFGMQYGDWNATTDKPVFSNYPFCIISSNSGNRFFTETAGTYNIKIEEYENSIETSECFEKAVKSAVGDVDKGYSCTETTTLLAQESVTTTDVGTGAPWSQLAYSEPITVDKLWVTFDGTEYVCDKVVNGPGKQYGDWNSSTGTPDFSRYPFCISVFMGNQIYTETEGTYNIKLEVRESSIETSECFEKARGYSCTESFTELFTETFTYDNAPSNHQLDYSGKISASKIKVTLNGTEYICDRTMDSGTAQYGDLNLTTYPFVLRSVPPFESGDFDNMFRAPNNGNYTLKVEALGTSAETSDCFAKAVKKILSITDATIVNSDDGLVSEPDSVVADLLNFALPVYIKEGDLQSMIFSSFQDGDGKWHFIVFDEHGTPREYITNNDGFPQWTH